jgi:hypothetical protein
MIKKIFTVARNDKKSRKKAIEILGKQENMIDADEVFGGKKEDFEKGGYFIDQTASTQINSAYQDPNDFI